MEFILKLLKSYLRWLIFGATVFFLLNSFKDHWQEVTSISITTRGWLCLVLAVFLTTLAHLWASSVWILILKAFKQSIPWLWGTQTYLKTNIAKYLPGNVWHFYGRVIALKEKKISLSIASLSVILEPLLTAAAAFIIVLLGLATDNLSFEQLLINGWIRSLSFLVLGGVVVGIHPIFINPILKVVRQLKVKNQTNQNLIVKLEGYPWLPLFSALGFLILRGMGFVLALSAFIPLNISQLPLVITVFSLAWLLGLIIPGAPGGVGVFETTALLFLEPIFMSGILLSALAVFRVISITAEASGAGLAIISERLTVSR
ncbi:MAG: lysylphosphatidylglycerol synthase domain-containing protein [Microcystaceae cyanobacterium]